MLATDTTTRPAGRGRKILFTLVLVLTSLATALVIAEVVLRLVPIPGVAYHSFYYDDLTGGRYYPATKMTYRNARGDFVQRRVNSWGYADVDHALEKGPGAVRIGFFGDSYTHAAQVPIEKTFFRRIQARLNEASAPPHPRVECIAYGVSGYSMLQSYLECRRWMDRADLDFIVYVFVENDLGDQLRSMKPTQPIPFARLSGDTFVVDFSFRDRVGYKSSRWHRAQQYLKSNSLVVSTIEGRVKLLRRHGVKTRVNPAEMRMAEGAAEGKPLTSSVRPSEWPDSLRAEAAELGRRVLVRWTNEVRASGRPFIVLYVPRERELGNPYEEQDTWVAWLAGVCDELGIDMVDPSPELIARRDRGIEIYYDHWAAGGHEAAAEAFASYFVRAIAGESLPR